MLFIILVILIIVGIATNIKVVPQAQTYVIERLGTYYTTWETGLHVSIPFLDRVSKKISMKEQVVDFQPQPVITKDNVTMMVDSVVFYQITDPKLYAYGIERPLSAIENLTATTLRNIFGDLELDDTLTSRDTINVKITKILDEATDAWGIKVRRVELKNIDPPPSIQESMEKQMRAERERREAILVAEGQKQAAILVAEGEKESVILRAEAVKAQKITEAQGEAEAIKLVKQAEADAIKIVTSAKPSMEYLTIRKYEALENLSMGPATKLVVPAELQSLAGTISAITEIGSTQSTMKETNNSLEE